MHIERFITLVYEINFLGITYLIYETGHKTK